jgi:hypothetical protein
MLFARLCAHAPNPGPPTSSETRATREPAIARQLSTDKIPEVLKLYKDMDVKHEVLTLIPPQVRHGVPRNPQTLNPRNFETLNSRKP